MTFFCKRINFVKAVFCINDALFVESSFVNSVAFRFLILMPSERTEKKIGFYKNIGTLIQYHAEKKVGIHELMKVFVELPEFFHHISFPEH